MVINRYFFTGTLLLCIFSLLFLIKNIVSTLFLSFIVGFFIYSISIYVKKIIHSELLSIILSSFIFVILIIGVFLFISPFIHDQLEPMFTSIIPKVKSLIEKYNFFKNRFSEHKDLEYGINTLSEGILDAGLKKFYLVLKSLSFKLTSIFSNFIMVIVLGFLSAIERNHIIEFFISLFPKRYTKSMEFHIKNIIYKLYSYIRLQIMICVIFSIYYSIVFPAIGLPIQLGIFIGIMSIMPYIGFTIGIILSFLMLISSDFGLIYYILLSLIYVGAVLIENLLIMPVLVKNTLGLSPIYVISSMMLIEKFLGVLWLVFSFPICILLKFIIDIVIEQYKKTDFYNKK